MWTKWAKLQAKLGPTEWAKPAASWTCVYTRRGRPGQWRRVVEAVPPGRPAMRLGQLAATWCVTASAKSMELPHGPINTILWWK
jgi:hypothetical protein